MTHCRTCHQEIRRARSGGYGHVENPRHLHHYAVPQLRGAFDAGETPIRRGPVWADRPVVEGSPKRPTASPSRSG